MPGCQASSNPKVFSPQQIITKEIEANEWKRKYEESRMEVLEMRYYMALLF